MIAVQIEEYSPQWENHNKNLKEGPTFPHSIQNYEKSWSHQLTVDKTNNDVFLE